MEGYVTATDCHDDLSTAKFHIYRQIIARDAVVSHARTTATIQQMIAPTAGQQVLASPAKHVVTATLAQQDIPAPVPFPHFNYGCTDKLLIAVGPYYLWHGPFS
jgi:hypothetical protein